MTIDNELTLAGRSAMRLAEAIRSKTDIEVDVCSEEGSTQEARQSRLQMGVPKNKRKGHFDSDRSRDLLTEIPGRGKMIKPKTDRLLIVFFILLFILILYAFFYVIGLVLPQKAQRDFGLADPSMPTIQRVTYAVKLELQKDDLLQPVDSGGEERIFTIPYGETAAEVAARLEGLGLIRSSQAFIDLLVYLGNDSLIQTGIYSLSPSMNGLGIANHIVDSSSDYVVFSFLAGWRAEEIGGLLPLSGLDITYGDFLEAVGDPENAKDFLDDLGIESLEGFLSPGEYQVLRSANADDLAAAFVNGFVNRLPEGYEQNLEAMGLDLYEGVILASVIQKEMVLSEEGPLIASVFLNRLEADMPLQSDPTVQYALGYDSASMTWWKNPLTSDDLEVESPFNTYLREGLPPAPICNPDLDALLAVVNAKETDYLYFRAACDGSGSHVFSETYEEHIAAACQ